MLNTKRALVLPLLLGLSACSMRPCPVPEARKTDAGTAAPETLPAAQPAPRAALSFLRTEGNRLVNERGDTVQLRGCNVGGWLLLEPWIAGLDNQPNAETEKDIWDLLGQRFGEDTKQDLIRTFRESFFKEADAARIADLGLNCVRFPVWWRTTSDPAYGGDIAWLDRCIEWCRKNGVYVIIDLQGAPGGQAKESPNVGEPSAGGQFWRSQAFRDQAVDWWKMVAARYKDEPAVAFYDLLNEGTATPRYEDLVDFYDRLYKEIRAIDPRHILVMEDVWGFHRLPRPEDWGWENVVYSFHYYPRDMEPEQAIEAPDADLPKYNRTALYRGVPIYVGEFSTFDQRHGGTDAFFKYREAFDFLGWSWTFWTYKKIEENDYVLWGPYGYGKDRPRPDLNSDPAEKIRRDFERFATEFSEPHPLLVAAITAPSAWEPDPDYGPGALALSLRTACVLPGEKGYLRYEWGMKPPNLGYWTKGDTVAWKVEVPADGTYELGLRLGNNSDRNRVQVWLDGVHAANVSIPNGGGWRRFADRPLLNLALTKGTHVIEIGQADDEKGFVNLQGGWLKPAQSEAAAPDETALWLRPFNAAPLPPKSPIRVEWLNNPPNFGNWSPGEKVSWTIRLAKGGQYAALAICATPNSDSIVRLFLDGAQVGVAQAKSSGDWQKYEPADLGTVDLKPGEHTITFQWDIPRNTAPGNLREIRLERLP